MITEITVENFKGICNKMRIGIKPITLLFGINSAGKSTIVQALHYAREVLEKQNFDPDKTLYGGDVIDLGGFKNLVHNRELDKSITMRFNIDLSSENLSEYITFQDKFVSDLSNKIQNAWIEFVIRWHTIRETPVVTLYEVGINGRKIGKIGLKDEERFFVDQNLAYGLTYDPYHPVIADAIMETEDFIGKTIEWENSYPYTINVSSAIPVWGKRFDITINKDKALEFNDPNIDPETSVSTLDDDQIKILLIPINDIFSQIFIAPGIVLKSYLRKFRYLGPFRQIPPRNYKPALTENELFWSDGIAAWDLLYKKDQDFIDKVNGWLFDEDKLNTGYKLKMRFYKEVDLDSFLGLALIRGTLFDDVDIKEEANKIPTQKRLVLIEKNRNLEVMPQDIGVGISQILPIIVAALDTQAEIVAIEQPELHIHPAIQVNLADLFISQIHKDKIFLIETHSEHVLLRFMRRIRETSQGNIPAEELEIEAKDLVVHFVEVDNSKCFIQEMPINSEGELVKAWPGGFFEERLGELF